MHFYYSVSVLNPIATLKIWDSKNEDSREKWTPNSLNYNMNFPNSVHMSGYKLPITGQNLAEKGLA